MSELIHITTDPQGGLVVNSLDFAAGLDIQHKNLLETIRTHQAAIEADFGLIAFETRKVEGKGRPELVAHLTEDQALFVGTLSRNSPRVVAFKSVLVRSFAEARRQLTLTPALPSATEQALLQLVSQQTQLMAGQQQLLQQLRTDVDQIRLSGQRPPARSRRLTAPPQPPHLSLRSTITRKVNEYCARFEAEQGEAYSYLYKRMFDVYGVNVRRLIRTGSESLLDAVERYGYLEKLYSLIQAELSYTEE